MKSIRYNTPLAALETVCELSEVEGIYGELSLPASTLVHPSPPPTPWNSLRARILRRTRVSHPNQVDGAALADDDDAPSGSSTVTSRTPGAGARPEGGASKKAISALLFGLRLTPRLAMALLCRTTCCSSQAREGWRCASWAICARSVFFGR